MAQTFCKNIWLTFTQRLRWWKYIALNFLLRDTLEHYVCTWWRIYIFHSQNEFNITLWWNGLYLLTSVCHWRGQQCIGVYCDPLIHEVCLFDRVRALWYLHGIQLVCNGTCFHKLYYALLIMYQQNAHLMMMYTLQRIHIQPKNIMFPLIHTELQCMLLHYGFFSLS